MKAVHPGDWMRPGQPERTDQDTLFKTGRDTFANLKHAFVQLADRLDRDRLAEPLAPWFCGMGGVFLRRRLRPKSEILNDINGEIVNLFRILRDHPDALAGEFDVCLAARAEFERLLKTPPETLTDIRRASRWAFLQRMSFSGKPAHLATPGDYTASVHEPARISSARMTGLIRAAHARLQGVYIECLDWADFIARYDRDFTLFYLDPPYWGHEEDYGPGVFARDDFARLAEMLRGIKGRFILSINDRPEIREMFSWADVGEVGTRYSVNGPATRRVTELLISGGGSGFEPLPVMPSLFA